jgi:hypothetical protein
LGVNLFPQVVPDGCGHGQEGFHDFGIKLASGKTKNLFAGCGQGLRRAPYPELARLGSSAWTPRNDNLNAWAMTLALYAVLVAVFGVGGLGHMAIQYAKIAGGRVIAMASRSRLAARWSETVTT